MGMHLRVYNSLTTARAAWEDRVNKGVLPENVEARESRLSITYKGSNNVEKFVYANQSVDCDMYRGLDVMLLDISPSCSPEVKARLQEIFPNAQVKQ